MQYGLIGAGKISEHYFAAAQLSSDFTISGAYDSDQDALKRLPLDCHRHTSLDALLNDSNIDAVIISTPTADHAGTALRVLDVGIPIALEKPVALNNRTLADIRRMSEKKKCGVFSLFHAAYGLEVGHASKMLRENYQAGDKLNWSFSFCDPYNSDASSKASLINSWIDSGINAISIIQAMTGGVTLDLKASLFNPKKGKNAEWGTDWAKVKFSLNGSFQGEVDIATDWTRQLNAKTSHLLSDEIDLVLNHSDECLIVAGRKQEVFDFHSNTPRLTTHYLGALSDASSYLSRGASNWEFTEMCHLPYFNAFPGEYT